MRPRKTNRHANRPRGRVTTGQIRRVRRYFNQANPAIDTILQRVKNLERNAAGVLTVESTAEYNRMFSKVFRACEHLRHTNHVSQKMINNVMEFKGWTKETVSKFIP